MNITEPDQCDHLLIAGAFTILGVLLGTLLTYWLSIHLARQRSRQDTGRKLRDVFTPLISSLTNPDWTDLNEQMKVALKQQYKAVIDYTFYLNGSNRKRFLVAWYSFRDASETADVDSNSVKRKQVLNQIYEILAYTIS